MRGGVRYWLAAGSLVAALIVAGPGKALAACEYPCPPPSSGDPCDPPPNWADDCASKEEQALQDTMQELQDRVTQMAELAHQVADAVCDAAFGRPCVIG